MNRHYWPIHTLLLLLACSYYLGYTPPLLALLFLLASGWSYLAYARDKSAARLGTWRVPEKTLHLTALLGGWPGAIVAQQRLRHKTAKRRFRLLFWLTVVVNLTLFAWLHTATGSRLLQGYSDQVEQRLLPVATQGRATRVLLALIQRR